jgi:glyoxylase-like metal-dependent hydrolase (beta-lactamase superfamily II)
VAVARRTAGLVADPGDAQPVRTWLERAGLQLEAILVTHHRADRIGGCGRLFEGTPAQMPQSIYKLAALPDATRVCCTHGYTLSNLKFATVVEPGNTQLIHYRQQCGWRKRRSRPAPMGPWTNETK